MKIRNQLLCLLALCFISTANAQFFKKLSKRAKDAAEDAVERKVQEKTERETEKAFDTVFNNQGKLFKGKKPVPAESYEFTHEYVMKLISGKDTTNITYYLTNVHEYMGNSFQTKKNQEFITVMDLPNTAIHTFMNMGGQKSSTSIRIDLKEVANQTSNNEKFTITPTGQTKTIVGFHCEEFQVTGPQLSGKIWVTQEADISFQKAFNRLQTKKFKGLKGVDQSWISLVDGLTLEMKMKDYSQRNSKPLHMTCTSLTETDFSIDTTVYTNPF